MMYPKFLRRYPILLPKPRHLTTGGIGHQKRKRLKSSMKRLRLQQKQIKEGQRQVSEKCGAIELECEQLRKETDLIIKQSFNTQIRLALMFQILKARENHEFDKATQLTCALREAISRENQETNASEY
ncbi:hypothetical protein PTKIN_Ptkin14bG0088100 [Pterospermum kingtungense]